jgi:hypothetical protein
MVASADVSDGLIFDLRLSGDNSCTISAVTNVCRRIWPLPRRCSLFLKSSVSHNFVFISYLLCYIYETESSKANLLITSCTTICDKREAHHFSI